MARLPRYQESGLISADVPRFDFANVREQNIASQGLMQSLDRLAQFAFGKAREEQEQRNQIVGIQMRSDMEGEVQKRFAELTVAVQTGQLTDFNQIQEEVKALSGYASELAQVSPQQANGLMTSIQAGGKALMAKSADILTKAYTSQADQRTDELIGSLSKNLETMYEVADSPETMEQYVRGARGIALANAINNPDTLNSKMDDFEKANAAARNAVLGKFIASSEFAKSPSERLAKIRSGDIGRYSTVWQGLGQAQKDKLVDSMNKRLADEYTLVTKEQQLQESLVQNEVIDTYDLFLIGQINGNEVLQRYNELGYIPSKEEVKAIRSGDVPGAPDHYYGALEYQARLGTLTAKQANELFVQNRISLKQRNGLFSVIDKSERPEMAAAKEFIGNEFVPNPMDPSTRQGNVRRGQVINQLIQEEAAARTAGKPFDALARAQQLVKQRMAAEDIKVLQDTRDRLRKKLEENKITYREDLTANDLKEAGVNNNDIKVIIRLIRSIEGLK